MAKSDYGKLLSNKGKTSKVLLIYYEYLHDIEADRVLLAINYKINSQKVIFCFSMTVVSELKGYINVNTLTVTYCCFYRMRDLYSRQST